MYHWHRRVRFGAEEVRELIPTRGCRYRPGIIFCNTRRHSLLYDSMEEIIRRVRGLGYCNDNATRCYLINNVGDDAAVCPADR